jgi:uncharacterized protein YifN (PemK superfamily)
MSSGPPVAFRRQTADRGGPAAWATPKYPPCKVIGGWARQSQGAGAPVSLALRLAAEVADVTPRPRRTDDHGSAPYPVRMELRSRIRPGMVLVCEFPPQDQIRPGEMTKVRPVVVVNRRMSSRPGLVNVIPISMTPPHAVAPWHVAIPATAMPVGWREKPGTRWAKCDMVATVSIERLRASTRHSRVPVSFVEPETLSAIRIALGYIFEIV